MTITQNERIALNMIALNDYQPANGGRPESFEDTSMIWSNCLDCHSSPESLSGRTLSATVASLAKKGLVVAYNDKRRKDDTVALTKEGYDVWAREWPATVVEAGNK